MKLKWVLNIDDFSETSAEVKGVIFSITIQPLATTLVMLVLLDYISSLLRSFYHSEQ